LLFSFVEHQNRLKHKFKQKERRLGFLDGILGNVVGSVLGGSGGQQSQNPLGGILSELTGGDHVQSGNLMQAAMSMLQQQGGLESVLGMFRSKGMDQEADSWVGTGANIGVSAAQVQQVFGKSALGDMAEKLGMSQGEASSAMAKVLPELVNQMTPEGRVPENHNDLISQGLAMLGRGL
jgi:uncharacterized protein YidB (DUF937 family)